MKPDSELIRKHFFNPHNVGAADRADGVGRAGSLRCGAALRISIQVDEGRRIAAADFKAAGCSVLVAAASYLTDRVKGLTSAEAAALARAPESDLAPLFCEAAPDRQACIRLSCEALLQAITDYSNAARAEWEGDEALICTCFCVSERT